MPTPAFARQKRPDIAAIVEKIEFWQDLEFIHDLMQPFCDGIHQIESDTAVLSVIYFLYKDLDVVVDNKLN
jgi:hypothetical protein